MSEQKHTPEPWRVGGGTGEPYNWRGEIIATTGDGRPMVLACCNQNFQDLGIANARRIVACVNACAGVKDSTLDVMCGGEGVNVQGLLEAAMQLERQRDELLAALKNAERQLRDVAYPDGDICVNPDAEDVADESAAAIAKAEGRQND